MAENEFVSDSDECLVTEAINLDIEEVSVYAIVIAYATILCKIISNTCTQRDRYLAERIALCHLSLILLICIFCLTPVMTLLL